MKRSKSASPVKASKTHSISSFSSFSRKFREPSNEPTYEGSSWLQRYTPHASHQISIHPKKLKETSNAIESMVFGKSGKKILLLAGPAGCGKSTCASILGDELIRKYKTSGHHLTNDKDTVIEFITTADVSGLSLPRQFQDFLLQARVLNHFNKKLLLVEDLPNLFHEETCQLFHQSLWDWLEWPGDLPPLVICITETEHTSQDWFDERRERNLSFGLEHNYIAETILNGPILRHRCLQRINYNPVARTYLKKCLQTISSQESTLLKSRQVPKSDLDDCISRLSETGDLRSAICSFELWAHQFRPERNDHGILVGKENGMGIFSAVGKVIFGTQHPEQELLNHLKSNNQTSLRSPDQIDTVLVENVIRNYSSRCTFFNLNLLENYTATTKTDSVVDQTLCDVAHQLSLCDTLKSEYSLEIGARATRMLLANRGRSVSKLRFSRDSKRWKKINLVDRGMKEFERMRLALQESTGVSAPTRSGKTTLALYDGFYEPLVLSRTGNKVPRIGGSLSNIMLADTEIISPEKDQYTPLKELEEKYINMVENKPQHEEEDVIEDSMDDWDEKWDETNNTEMDELLTQRSGRAPSDDILSDSDLDNI